jgi:hypothetical protein
MKTQAAGNRIFFSTISRHLPGFSIPVIMICALILSSCAGKGNDGDTVPPEIIAATPLAGSQDIPLNTTVTITFSKPVTGINTNSVYLKKLGVFGQIPANVRYDRSTTWQKFPRLQIWSRIRFITSRLKQQYAAKRVSR